MAVCLRPVRRLPRLPRWGWRRTEAPLGPLPSVPLLTLLARRDPAVSTRSSNALATIMPFASGPMSARSAFTSVFSEKGPHRLRFRWNTNAGGGGTGGSPTAVRRSELQGDGAPPNRADLSRLPGRSVQDINRGAIDRALTATASPAGPLGGPECGGQVVHRIPKGPRRGVAGSPRRNWSPPSQLFQNTSPLCLDRAQNRQ